MVTVRKRNGRYFVDYTAGGKRKRKSVGTSKPIAELLAKELEVKIAREESGLFTTDILIKDFLEKCNDYSKTAHRKNTYVRYREALDHFREFLKRIPGQKISSLTPEVFDKYKSFRSGKVKNGTINMELKIFKMFLNLAVRWDHLRHNPLSRVPFLPNIDRKIPRFYTIKEAKEIIKHTQEPYRDILLVLLYTGLRRNELRYLEVEDIDLDNRKIHVRAKKDFTPKTAERKIPIFDDILPILKKQIKTHKKGLLFPNAVGKVYDERRWWKVLQRVAERAGIANLDVHTFRHTFASWLIMNGTDLKTVGELLGHSDYQTTMIYSHLSDEHVKKSVSNLPSIMTSQGALSAHLPKQKRKPS